MKNKKKSLKKSVTEVTRIQKIKETCSLKKKKKKFAGEILAF